MTVADLLAVLADAQPGDVVVIDTVDDYIPVESAARLTAHAFHLTPAQPLFDSSFIRDGDS